VERAVTASRTRRREGMLATPAEFPPPDYAPEIRLVVAVLTPAGARPWISFACRRARAL
jgi:hypothetical protein